MAALVDIGDGHQTLYWHCQGRPVAVVMVVALANAAAMHNTGGRTMWCMTHVWASRIWHVWLSSTCQKKQKQVWLHTHGYMHQIAYDLLVRTCRQQSSDSFPRGRSVFLPQSDGYLGISSTLVHNFVFAVNCMHVGWWDIESRALGAGLKFRGVEYHAHQL